MRGYNIDDAAAIWVNEQLVGVSSGGRETGWITINNSFQPGKDTTVAFASFNGAGPSSRAFSVRRDDVSVWGFESQGGAESTLNYSQQLAIHPDGRFEEIKLSNVSRKLLPGKWYVRIQNVQDIGGILVNGQPVAIYWNAAGNWTEVTNLLYADQDNRVTFSAWNYQDAYSWDFAIKNDDIIVWAKESSGSGLINKVFEDTVIIDPSGKVTQSQSRGKAADYIWSLRSFKTDDAAVIFVNEELIGVSGLGRGETNWVGINKYMKSDQDTVIAFASFNGAGPSSRAFMIRRDDTIIWGFDSSGGAEWTLNYAQQLVIHPDGSIEPIKVDTSVRKPPPGKWYVRIQNVQDIGGILVNGQPVAVFWNRAGGWIDITNLLYSNRDNKIVVAAWNFSDAYSWDFAIKRDETIVWQVNNNGSGQVGKVFSAEVLVTGNGEIRH